MKPLSPHWGYVRLLGSLGWEGSLRGGHEPYEHDGLFREVLDMSLVIVRHPRLSGPQEGRCLRLSNEGRSLSISGTFLEKDLLV